MDHLSLPFGMIKQINNTTHKITSLPRWEENNFALTDWLAPDPDVCLLSMVYIPTGCVSYIGGKIRHYRRPREAASSKNAIYMLILGTESLNSQESSGETSPRTDLCTGGVPPRVAIGCCQVGRYIQYYILTQGVLLGSSAGQTESDRFIRQIWNDLNLKRIEVSVFLEPQRYYDSSPKCFTCGSNFLLSKL